MYFQLFQPFLAWWLFEYSWVILSSSNRKYRLIRHCLRSYHTEWCALYGLICSYDFVLHFPFMINDTLYNYMAELHRSITGCRRNLITSPTTAVTSRVMSCDLAPVPLSIFRSNSKFDENSKHSSVQYTRPITTIFCTRHDSVTVVTCAKYRCDRSSIFKTRAFWIFIEFRIRSKYA